MYAIIPGLLNQLLLRIIYSSSRFNADAKGGPEFLSCRFTENTHALPHQIASLSPLLQARRCVIVYFLCCILCHPHQSCEMGTIIILILQRKHGGPESIIHRHTVQKWRAEIQTWGFLPQLHYIFFIQYILASHSPSRTAFICRGVSRLPLIQLSPFLSLFSPFPSLCLFPFPFLPPFFLLPPTSFYLFPFLSSPPLLPYFPPIPSAFSSSSLPSPSFLFSFSAYPIHHFIFWDWLVFHTLLQSQACLYYIQYAHFIYFFYTTFL